ncbi:MAG: FKBP-type peptidyl-prolyl cis-trans isomerase, partial [Verrucomicrobiota bacterium]
FDSSRQREEPLEFKIGESNILSGVENAVEGMEEGQKKTITLTADEAYGQPREDLVTEFAKEDFPDHIEPEEGMMLELKNQEGQPLVVQVKEVGDEKVTLDGNHPLAGHDLTFDVELVEVTENAS